MRSVTRRRRFTPLDIMWASTTCEPHRFTIDGIEYTHNGHHFMIDGRTIANLGRMIHHFPGDILELISATKPCGRYRNYLGYCREKNYYRTFDEHQVKFI
jgi:hypothetical protein